MEDLTPRNFSEVGSKITRLVVLPVAFLLTLATLYVKEVSMAITLSAESLSPIAALVIGILILVMPKLLNFLIAAYLIIIGLIGLFGTNFLS